MIPSNRLNCRQTVTSLAIATLMVLPLSFANADSPAKSAGLAAEKPATGPSVKVDGGYMVPYSVKIPGTDVTFEMIPVPAGSFKLGSPDDEKDRGDDEGPQIEVNVDPMWVAKTEVSWAEYQEYMKLYAIFKEFEASGTRAVNDDNKVDAITAPTELYDPSFTYEYGEDLQQPAVTMTIYAAQQYTKWLSLTTGQQFRLPTEAEWEYAARAGTTSAFSWGDDADAIDDYAAYFDNSDEGPSQVAQKKPNAFGLYDMHGNAAELTVNQYTEDGYASFASTQPLNAIDVVKWPDEAYPCVVRGGSWEMDPPECRSAARLATDDEEWKEEDPNFPRSPWWYTSDPSRGVGFRIFRSYKPLSDEKITKFWEPTSEDVVADVQSRIDGGRSGLGLIDKSLPEAIKELQGN